MSEYQVNLVCCTETIIQDLGAPKVTQKDVALTYAMAIKSEAQGADKPDWPTINRAILAKWKMSGLERIKKRAFDLLRGVAKATNSAPAHRDEAPEAESQ